MNHDYPLVNVYIAIENHKNWIGKTPNFYGPFSSSRTVGLLEGIPSGKLT